MRDRNDNGNLLVTKMSDIDFTEYISTDILSKYTNHLFKRCLKSALDCNMSVDALFLILDKYHQLFADEYGEIKHDRIKRELNENIKKKRPFIDKIQEIKMKLNLEIHHEF